ncbi:MAG: Lrp/AsnC family transcriptional regulator [Candidatus Woesearchaeota archaeon]
MELDEKDLRIIEALQEDARATIKWISHKTGIKQSTVHQRMQRLIREGVIERFSVTLSPEFSEQKVLLFLGVEKPLPKQALQDKRITEAFSVSGEYDLVMKVQVKNISEFSTFLSELKSNYHIISSSSVICLSALK